MNVSYRAAVASAAPIPETTSALEVEVVEEPKPRFFKQGKVARISCCCKLSELMPLVRQLHDEVRAQNPEATPAQAA